MSSVGSPGDTSYFQDTIADFRRANQELEEEHSEEVDRLKERNENQTETLVRNQEEALQDTEESYNKTIKDMRENHQDAMEDDREISKRQLRDFQRDTYNRFGRIQGEKNDVQQQLSNAAREFEEERVRHQNAVDENAENYDRQIARNNQRHASELEEVADQIRQEQQGFVDEVTRRSQEDLLDFKKENEQRYRELTARLHEETGAERSRAIDAVDEVERNADRRAKNAERAHERRLEAVLDHLNEKTEERIRDQRLSHIEETQNLRTQVKDAQNAKREFLKNRNEARVEAVSELQEGWATRQEAIQRSYDDIVNKLKNDNAETELYLRQRNQENIREKQEHFTDLISQWNRDKKMEVDEIKEGFTRNNESLTEKLDIQREQAEQRLAERTQEMNLEKEDSLKNQARAFNSTIENMRKSKDQQIDLLEERLHVSQTSSDPNVVSPAAEFKIRRTVGDEYNRILEAEQERNEKNIDSIRESNSKALTEQKRTAERRDREVRAELLTEKDQERTRFLDQILDMEYATTRRLEDMERQHQSAVDLITGEFNKSLERQRHEYEEIIQGREHSNRAHIHELNQERAFEQKAIQRGHSAEMNQTIRDFERKLAGQEQRFEQEMEVIKEEAAQRVREAERDKRTLLSDQQRMWEQRLKETEMANEERIHRIEEDFKDRVESVRQSHERVTRLRG